MHINNQRRLTGNAQALLQLVEEDASPRVVVIKLLSIISSLLCALQDIEMEREA